MKHLKETAVFTALLLLLSCAVPILAVETDGIGPDETAEIGESESLPGTEPAEKQLPSMRISGPDSACAGDTVTLNVWLNGSERYLRGLQTKLEYSTEKMLLSDISCVNGWKLDAGTLSQGTGVPILVIDENFELPVTSEVRVFTVTFLLRENLTEGDAAVIRFHDTRATDWENVSDPQNTEDLPVEDALFAVNVLPPRSDDASLRSITVSEGKLSPAFNPGVLIYSVTVPYSVRYAEVNALPNDEKATVRVSGTALQVGSNTVTVTVTSESGIVWVYKLSVTRQKDPNYIPDANNSLSDVRLSSGTVSPKPGEKTDTFVVYLPFETDKLTVTPVPASKTASAEAITVDLTVGINEIPFTVKAEDGAKAEYLLYAVRHPAFGELEDIPIYVPETEPETEPETVPETLPETVPETDPVTDPPETDAVTDPTGPEKPEKSGISALWLLPAVLLSLIAGYAVCALLHGKKRKSEAAPRKEKSKGKTK